MSIKENTIASTTDTKVTLLQWLKTLDKSITELNEKGVKPSFKVMTTDEFLKSHETETTGVDFVIIESLGELWCIYGNYTINIQDGNDYGSIKVIGYLSNIYGEDGDKQSLVYTSCTLYLAKEDDKWEITDYDQLDDVSCEIATLKHIDEITNSTNYKALTDILTSRSTLLPMVSRYGNNAYGLSYTTDDEKQFFMGILRGNTGAYKHLQGIFVKGENEIYYSTGNSVFNINTGEIENAISGTELKEAVRLATQKTYWHSVKIKGANGFFTFNAPSTQNTPIDSVQDLTTLFDGDTWAGSGQYGSDMLFEIDLHREQPDFTKADDSSIGIASFGSLTISDDVKVVAE